MTGLLTGDMRDERSSLVVRRPLPGVGVIRFAGERPLMRAVPEHYGSTLHLAGRSRWKSGGEEWSSGPGSLSLKVPGEVSVERARARDEAVAFQVVAFETRMVDDARAALDRTSANPQRHAIEARDPRTAPLVALHHHLLQHPRALPQDDLEDLVCNALYALVTLMWAPPGTEAPRPVRFSAAVTRARALLDARFTETVGLDELAAHARLDKYRLCRAFCAEIGMPPHAYVTHRRVTLAQSLLAGGMPQAEVAARVGFYDQSLLHRHFKRILRLTPGAFAKASATHQGSAPHVRAGIAQSA